MDNLIFIIGALYTGVALFLWIGLNRKYSGEQKQPVENASLIICARDEEKNLPDCLAYIEEQTIDPERFEIILVDDASQDSTAELMEKFAEESRYPVQVLRLPPAEPGEPSGKWRPLKEGIKLAKNDAFLMTDADALLSPSWAEVHLQALADSDTAAGFVLITGNALWSQVQRLDWLFILGSGSAMAKWGRPQSALGKNMSIRRSTYEEIGGYDAIGFSLTEDLALVQAVAKQGGRQSYPCSPEMTAATTATPSWGEFIQQRKRWASGLLHLGFIGKALIALMALRNLAIIYCFFASLSSFFWIWVITAAANHLILQRIASKLDSPFSLKSFILWECFQTWTSPVQVLQMLASRGVEWKGRKH